MRVVSNKNIIVFGGAFSPPTLAHEAIITICLELPGYDEVWLLPSGNRTDKLIAMSAEHQLAMLAIVQTQVFGNEPRVRIDDRELARAITTETDDTYRELRSEYPDTNFWFVYGADSYQSIRSWQNGDELARTLPVLIVPRGEAPLPDPADHIRIMPALSDHLHLLSSTAVRSRVAQDKDISRYLSEPIAAYINQHSLFTHR